MGKSSKYDIRPITPDNYKEWDLFVASVPGGSFLMSTEWIGAVARTIYGEMKIWGVYRGDELVAGTGLISLRPLSITKLLRSVPLTPYTSIAIKPRNSGKEAKNGSYRLAILDLIARTLREEADAVEIVGHPGLTDIRPFSWRGWTDTVLYTYILDISDPTRIWNRLVDPTIRSNVRKCRESGIEILRGTDARALYDMQFQSLDKQGLSMPADRTSFYELCQVLKDNGRFEVYVAQAGPDTVCAYGVVKDYNARVQGFFGGTRPDHLKSGVAAYTLWTIIDQMAHEGYVRYDLAGANMPSIAAFKSQFGGVLTPYFSVHTKNSKARVLDWCWQKARGWGVNKLLKSHLLR